MTVHGSRFSVHGYAREDFEFSRAFLFISTESKLSITNFGFFFPHSSLKILALAKARAAFFASLEKKRTPKFYSYIILIWCLGALTQSFNAYGFSKNLEDPYTSSYILAAQDTIPLEDRLGDFVTDPNNNPFDLQDPGIINQNVDYDPETGQYIITETIGEDGGFFRPPTYMTFEE